MKWIKWNSTVWEIVDNNTVKATVVRIKVSAGSKARIFALYEMLKTILLATLNSQSEMTAGEENEYSKTFSKPVSKLQNIICQEQCYIFGSLC